MPQVYYIFIIPFQVFDSAVNGGYAASMQKQMYSICSKLEILEISIDHLFVEKLGFFSV